MVCKATRRSKAAMGVRIEKRRGQRGVDSALALFLGNSAGSEGLEKKMSFRGQSRPMGGGRALLCVLEMASRRLQTPHSLRPDMVAAP